MPSPMDDGASFQLQHADGDAVDVEHDVGPPLLVAFEGYLLGDGEVVFLRLLPVDEVDGLRDLSRLDLYRDAVAQQTVNGLVVAVEIAAVFVRLGAQLVERHADLLTGIAVSGKVVRQQTFLDVAVAVAVCPVAEIAIAQLIAEQGDDAVLRDAFRFVDGAHFDFPLCKDV